MVQKQCPNDNDKEIHNNSKLTQQYTQREGVVNYYILLHTIGIHEITDGSNENS